MKVCFNISKTHYLMMQVWGDKDIIGISIDFSHKCISKMINFLNQKVRIKILVFCNVIQWNKVITIESVLLFHCQAFFCQALATKNLGCLIGVAIAVHETSLCICFMCDISGFQLYTFTFITIYVNVWIWKHVGML